MTSFKNLVATYKEEFKKSFVFWTGMFYILLDVAAANSEYLRMITGERWFPFIMIATFYWARFRPSKVLPPKVSP